MAPFAHGVTCPACCPRIGCPCYIGTVTYGPPPIQPRPKTCAVCDVECPLVLVKCPAPTDCTAANAGYVIAAVQIPRPRPTKSCG